VQKTRYALDGFVIGSFRLEIRDDNALELPLTMSLFKELI
jgi:hypothetical protein